jgi:hypothetical protein
VHLLHSLTLEGRVLSRDDGIHRSRRTLEVEVKDEMNCPMDNSVDESNPVIVYRHPGVDESLKNLESRLAIRYDTFKFVLFHDVKIPSWSPPASSLIGLSPSKNFML